MANKQIHIILIGGQSNAVGCTDKHTLDEADRSGVYENVKLYQEGNFVPTTTGFILPDIHWGLGNYSEQMGIEYGIGAELNAQETTVGLIRCAHGGTDLVHYWATEFDTIPTNVEERGFCYYEFIGAVANGLRAYRDAGYKPIVKGMVWMQGESDANKTEAQALSYEDNLRKLFTKMRTALNMPDLKIIVGGISTEPPLAPYSDIVREKQRHYCETDENALYIDNTDLPIGDDGWHYNGNEDFQLGKRFGKAIKEFLLGK